jgi:hypothetical protein
MGEDGEEEAAYSLDATQEDDEIDMDMLHWMLSAFEDANASANSPPGGLDSRCSSSLPIRLRHCHA